MSKEKKDKVFQEISEELASSQAVLVKNALKKIRKKGDERHIRPMLKVLLDKEHEELFPEINEMLSSLKISSGEYELLTALEEEEFFPIRKEILSFIWNSGFEPVDQLPLISSIAISGDYMTALEALTLIENMEGPFDEAHVLESLVEVRTFLSDNPKAETRDLIASLQGVLIQFESQVE